MGSKAMLGASLASEPFCNFMAKEGRPTKYKKKYADMLVDYFTIDPVREVEETYTNKKGETWTKTVEKACEFPTFEGFACSIGVTDHTLQNWCEATDEKGMLLNPEFLDAYKRAKELQKQVLVVNSMAGRYNTQFAIFIAKNVTDLRDKVEAPTDANGNVVPYVAGFQLIVPHEQLDNPNT